MGSSPRRFAPGDEHGKAFKEQVVYVAKSRSFSIVKDTSPHRIAKLSGDEVFKTRQYMPKALKRSTRLK